MAGKFDTDKMIYTNLEHLQQLLLDREKAIDLYASHYKKDESDIIAIEAQIISCIKLLNSFMQELEEKGGPK